MFETELARLKADYGKLPMKDQAFALSLLNQLARKGVLSPKQWPWIKTLADRIDPPAGPAPRKLGDLAQLKAMFAKAGEKLKFPHLMLQLDSGERVKLWIAGDRSSDPGALSVVTTDREWIGRVLKDGTWAPRVTRSAEFYASVGDLLSRLLADPVGVLASHGKQLGACCYCNTELTDARSVAAGYGPVCAKNWGLPWGDTDLLEKRQKAVATGAVALQRSKPRAIRL
jgi:hypothetical protein